VCEKLVYLTTHSLLFHKTKKSLIKIKPLDGFDTADRFLYSVGITKPLSQNRKELFTMKNIQREISRNIPNHLPKNLAELGEAIFTAYGCAMLERDTDKEYIYTALNLETGKRKMIKRQKMPLTTSGVEAMAESIRLSKVAGFGRLEADRPFGNKIALEKCRETLNTIFNEILPEYGYKIRREQISLAEHILNALDRRSVSLAEAEVGTGKTLAYLVPAVLAKRGRFNGYWNMSFYTGTPYADTAHMPIVIATSSIALQKAIITDYIPELSRILLENEIIKTPLTAVLRKGREHYVCERNLRRHVLFEHNITMKEILEDLLKPNAVIDLAEIDGLTAHVKSIISVPDRCDEHCPHRESCQYLKFREYAQFAEIDIQVCNHNYLLADIFRRRDEQRPLIPNYQNIIIDEAHKFLQAARTMYGVEFSSNTLVEIKNSIYDNLNLKYENAKKIVKRLAKKLSSESSRLFRRLVENAESEDTDEEADRFTTVIDEEAHRHIRNIHNISEGLIELLKPEPVVRKSDGRKKQILWELEQVRKQTGILIQYDKLIYWLEKGDDENKLCAIPRDLDKRLFDDIWSRGIPTVLTSGTLSAAGDFSHTKRTLGLHRLGGKLIETSKPSPFDYYKNALLYIPENMPFPDQLNKMYINAISNETERLITVSHGHSAVLFTSYKAMDMVWEQLSKRGIPFPMFRLDKGGVREIERFKQSKNGVLFASGALWEGIDIPGDALSMLIIVKLPFAVPDPISEYEQTLYEDMDEYKRKVVVPEMLIKLKQGFGRLIRTETDTGVVAILDCRVNKKSAYRERALNALPDCFVTNDIDDVEEFIHNKKSADYFI